MIDCDRNALNGWDSLRVSNAPFTYIKWIYLCAYVCCVRGRKCKPVMSVGSPMTLVVVVVVVEEVRAFTSDVYAMQDGGPVIFVHFLL